MPNLYIITGPAGVGKSTISQKIAENHTKSVWIEGDIIYHQIVGGYTPAWKEGNHLAVFWKVCLDMIETYLSYDYDVIFNYIVTPSILHEIEARFQQYTTKFVVLTVAEKTLLARDKERPIDCQMGDRCIILLNQFKNMGYNEKYFLDTTCLSIEETVEEIEKNDQFLF